MDFTYARDIYAGVLGKMIGVYLGRPVEGWPYGKIKDRFGEVSYYVHEDCGVPLIVADDDLSGTFGFFRALEDNLYRADISARDIGDAWLNYIIEDKTILWWGGLGRSTEHTAFLNLKDGIPAPRSGSIAQNGRTLAEQIGAQIFMDAFAMACPNDPDRAVDLVRKAASVSHDGVAVAAACYLGAMEAMAFEEKDICSLMDRALAYVSDPLLLSVIEDVRAVCARESDWRSVRAFLDSKYGYHIFPGCCHVVPNHAMVLASLLLGGDDFQKSVAIAASAGWDTDCNAGNVGALNGIRLGLAGIDAGADFRGPVADRLYVVTADGGSTVSDAVQEARRIVRAARAFSGEGDEPARARYAFEFPGATQGFEPCPYHKGVTSGVAALRNQNERGGENGLAIVCDRIARGVDAEVSTPTFLDFSRMAKNFSTIASPSLYPSQTVEIRVRHLSDAPLRFAPYVLYYDIENRAQKLEGETVALRAGMNAIDWVVPDTGGMPIFRLGFSIGSQERFSGVVIVESVDWRGAPRNFEQRGMLMTSIWNTNPFWTQTWASSAKHFAADFKYTYCISHPEDNGVVTMGTREWDDYSVASGLCFSLHKAGGLVLRSRGHRRYYAALLAGLGTAVIVKREDGVVTELARSPFPYSEDIVYGLEFRAKGERLELRVNGESLLVAEDATYSSGAAGFLVRNGTMTADGFAVRAL
jgi:ADP-ribosylglycohydrolase